MTNAPLSRSEYLWLHRSTIGLLMLLGCLIMVNASSVVDTARDVYYAWQIASGGDFPLEGPTVGAVFHGGPVWFYLLAVPLLIKPSWIVMSLWVGLLTGMKYILAYACGARLVDRTFGLLWACLLAFPDWTSVNYLIFSHTNLVETSLLLCCYSLIRWQEGATPWFLMMCLAMGLGIHAHPTVYAAGVLAVPFIIRSLWRRELAWWWIPVGALVAALPMAPYIISQSLQRWPDLQTSGDYFDSQPLWMNLQGFGDVMQGALLDGPLIALSHVLGLEGTPLTLTAVILGALLVPGLLFSCLAVIRRSSGLVPLWLLSATLLCIAAVALIRNVTPFYQTFVIYPPFYGLVAWGWWYFLKSTGFPVTRVFIPTSIACLCGVALATFQMGREGHVYIPRSSLMDVRTHEVGQFADTIYYPGWGRQQLASFICGEQRPLFLHGFASFILEQSYALEARMRCKTDEVFMGGQGAGRHFLGINNRDSRQLGIRSEFSLGSMGLFEVDRVVVPSEPMSIPEGDQYPPRPYYFSGESERVLDIPVSTGQMLAITNLYEFWMPHSVEVFLDGRLVDPQSSSRGSTFYTCTDCAPGSVQNWSVTIAAPKPEFVEVVTFTPARQAP